MPTTIDLATATPLAPSFMTGTGGSVSMPGNLSVTGTTTFTGTTTATTVTSEKPLVNVLFFGADPMGVADSTAAVQNAINFAMTAGNPLYFPTGTYKITSALTYSWLTCNEMLVLGDGPQATTISYTAATGNLFTCTGTAAQRKSLGFRNIGMKATAATTAVAISYVAGQRCHVQNCQITGFFGGVRITGTGLVGDGSTGNSFDIHIQDSLINNYVAGGYAINVDHSTDLFLTNLECYAVGDSDVTSTGIIFDTGANGNYISHVNVVSGLHGIWLKNSTQGGNFGGIPSGFYMESVLADTIAGGDAWLFDSTLSANNVVMFAANCWARRAGINSSGATVVAGAIGINVSGGSDIHFLGGWALENALNGVSVTSTGSNISFTDCNVQRNNFNNNTASTPGATVNANPTRVRFIGGMYNNLGGGNQNFGIDYSANTSTTIFGMDADNNASGPVNPSSAPVKILMASAIASADTFPSTDTAAFIRLASNRYLSIRNVGNTANLNLISKSASDVVQVGDAAGVTTVGQMNKIGQADIVSSSGAINTADTIIVKTPALAANRLAAGTHIRIVLDGTCTSTAANTSTFTLRIGTLGTTGDGTVAAFTTSAAATSGTNNGFRAVIDLTVRTAGASATSQGMLQLTSDGNIGIVATPNVKSVAGSTFNSTTANLIVSISYVSAASTTTSTFTNATIEIVQN